MKIRLMNSARCLAESGYGVINKGLLKLAACADGPECGLSVELGDVDLYASPPYSFKAIPGRISIGLTMTERSDLSSYSFPFVAKCNEMTAIMTTSEEQAAILRANGVKVPVVAVPLWIDYAKWSAPNRTKAATSCMVFDRGRDVVTSSQVAFRVFSKVVSIKSCGMPDAELKHLYVSSDVFLKWCDRNGPGEGWCFPILEAMSAGCIVVTNAKLPYLKPGNHLPFSDETGLVKALAKARAGALGVGVEGQKTAASLTLSAALDVIKKAIEGLI